MLNETEATMRRRRLSHLRWAFAIVLTLVLGSGIVLGAVSWRTTIMLLGVILMYAQSADLLDRSVE